MYFRGNVLYLLLNNVSAGTRRGRVFAFAYTATNFIVNHTDNKILFLHHLIPLPYVIKWTHLSCEEGEGLLNNFPLQQPPSVGKAM